MHLETSEGIRTQATEANLARFLDRPPPLAVLRGPGIALVALHAQGPRYTLMHWNGRVWQQSAPEVHESSIGPRFINFFNGGGEWRDDLSWDTIRCEPHASGTPALTSGMHVLISFILIFGGFATGAALGVAAGRQAEPYDAVFVYVFALLFAPPLAILGQLASRAIPSACDACGEAAITLHTGRFSYLCTECGHLNITRWGIHRGPMAP